MKREGRKKERRNMTEYENKKEREKIGTLTEYNETCSRDMTEGKGERCEYGAESPMKIEETRKRKGERISREMK
jgi:hypothetical protein